MIRRTSCLSFRGRDSHPHRRERAHRAAFHQRAHDWWADEEAGGASCPLVENGVTRIMSNPAYSSGRHFRVEELIQALSAFVEATDHESWSDSLSLRDSDVFARHQIHGGRHLTDLYLLALAAHRGGRLVTFDHRIALSAVKTAEPANVLVL